MKPWLVDVPFRVNIWIRPSCQKAQFEVLRQARPSVMFLVSDGGRNEKEWAAIRENRALFDTSVDWDCTIYKLYEEQNNGLYTMGRKGAELIWSKVDRCIFLEDDYVPSVSYFRFCAELLEKYKDDTRIEAICGMNHCGTWDCGDHDYFFSEVGSIWGQAYWKRSYQARDPEHTYGKDPYVLDLLCQRTADSKLIRNKFLGYAKNPLHENHRAGGEFYHLFEIFGQNKLYIVPRCNMISNIGATADGTHSSELKLLPHGLRQVFNLKTQEMQFPLRHLDYVIADRKYREAHDRIMGFDHPMIQFWRKIEGIFLSIRYKGLSGIVAKLKRRKSRKNTIEK